jgi:hypothetical protein
MTDPLKEQRWTELQFYYICLDILTINNDMLDVMDFIDNVRIFGNYAPDLIKPIAQEVLSSLRFRPSREEFIILCQHMKIPIRNIRERSGVHNRQIYQIIEAEQKDPRLFYPRLTAFQLEEVKKFLHGVKQLKGVGL